LENFSFFFGFRYENSSKNKNSHWGDLSLLITDRKGFLFFVINKGIKKA